MLKKNIFIYDKAKAASCYITKNNSDSVFTAHPLLCNKHLHILQKMLSFFFFTPESNDKTPPFYSAAPSSGDGSYCISWKILRQSLEVTAGATHSNTGSSGYLYTKTWYFSSISPCFSALCSPPWAGCISVVDQPAPCEEPRCLQALDRPHRGEALWNCAGG